MNGLSESTFAEVPREIRLMIVEATIEITGPIYVHFQHTKTPAIMRTCAQFCQDCVSTVVKEVRMIVALSPEVREPYHEGAGDAFGLQIPPILEQWINLPSNSMRVTRLDVLGCRVDRVTNQPTSLLPIRPGEGFPQEFSLDIIRNKDAVELLDLTFFNYLFQFNILKEQDGYSSRFDHKAQGLRIRTPFGVAAEPGADGVVRPVTRTNSTYFMITILYRRCFTPSEAQISMLDVLASIQDQPDPNHKMLNDGFRFEALRRMLVPAKYLMLTPRCGTQCAVDRMKGMKCGAFEMAHDLANSFEGPPFTRGQMNDMTLLFTASLVGRAWCDHYAMDDRDIELLLREAAAAYWEPFLEG
ncbi:Hypothetical protein D9617_54g000030 [Elsinoe fawcettii]|nr:Hypothetical protein D9617_54g000030 [Elsinoe fawcettii]